MVRPVTFTDVSEYMVAKAVVGAISIASAADGISVFDSILFLKLCSEQYCSAWGAYDDRGLLSAICTALGQLRTSAVSIPIFSFLKVVKLHASGSKYLFWLDQAEKELSEHISELAWVELERWLESEIAAPSPNYIVGVACLNAAVQLAGNGTCPPKTIQR